mmetsp:Transcript_44763/g.97337  ORF Transcript_44763/g.97337 Transcript_44763/m.97337 type:complete len:332 (-) Transcript_44763:84-1079(-)
MMMSPMVVNKVAFLPSAVSDWVAVIAAWSAAVGISLKTSRPPTAASAGSLLLKMKKRGLLYAAANSIGSHASSSSAASAMFVLAMTFFFISPSWYKAVTMNLSPCSTFPKIFTTLFVTTFTIFTPTRVPYSRKDPLSSKLNVANRADGDLRNSFSTATRRPKSKRSMWRSDIIGSFCAVVYISSDSSYSLTIRAVPNLKIRTCQSSLRIANKSPLLLTAALTAPTPAFCSSYKLVSDLSWNLMPFFGSGSLRVSGSQISICPSSSIESTQSIFQLYFRTRTGCWCKPSNVLITVLMSSALYICTFGVSSSAIATLCTIASLVLTISTAQGE